ncbi:hypothetical protein [Nonomuraea sp. KM88]|uniref:hypothetical protein n=1 Tax=Nonomuraea sp. KM88 TaxID=3457427 RepID=UPI003FCC41AC
MGESEVDEAVDVEGGGAVVEPMGLIYTIGRSPSDHRLFDAETLWCVRSVPVMAAHHTRGRHGSGDHDLHQGNVLEGGRSSQIDDAVVEGPSREPMAPC